MRGEAKSWAAILATWYLIGLFYTDATTSIGFLLIPVLVGAIAGLVLAELKRHHLHDYIEHDILEMAAAVTAGAAAFTAAIFLLALALPLNTRLDLQAIYYIIATPAGIALSFATYLAAKHFTPKPPTKTGLLATAVAAVLLIAAGGIASTTLLDQQPVAPTNEQPLLSPGDEPVLQELAAQEERILYEKHQTTLTGNPRAFVQSVDTVIQNRLVREVHTTYLAAQDYLRNDNFSRVQPSEIESSPCYEQLRNPGTADYRPFFDSPTSPAELVQYRVYKASNLDEMTQEIHAIATRSQRTRAQIHTDLYANAAEDEDPLSTAVRYRLVKDHLDEGC